MSHPRKLSRESNLLTCDVSDPDQPTESITVGGPGMMNIDYPSTGASGGISAPGKRPGSGDADLCKRPKSADEAHDLANCC